MTHSFLESEAALNALIAGFEDGTWPKSGWTHGAHLAMGAFYVLDGPDALKRMRANIPKYNVSQGGANTEDSGYHDTLTVFWHDRIRECVAALPDSCARLEIVRRVVGEFESRRDLFREYYSFDVVRSREARARWVPPDRMPAQ